MRAHPVRVSTFMAAVWAFVAFGCATAAAQVDAPDSSALLGGQASGGRLHLAAAGFMVDKAMDSRDTWLATAVEEALARRLRSVPGLIMVPTVRVHQARRELQDDETTLPQWPRVVAALGADLMLTGRCRGTPAALVLQIKLVEPGAGAQVRAETTLAVERLFAALDAATRWTLGELGLSQLSPEIERLIFEPPARSPSALEYYARAVAAARADRAKDVHYYAMQALEYDKRFRPALAMLAHLELQRGRAGFPSARARLRVLSDLARIHADPLDWAAAELGQGILLQLTGAFDAAYTRFETSLATSYEHEAIYGQLAAVSTLCDLYLTRGIPAGVGLTDDQIQRFKRQNLRRAAEWQEVGLELLLRLGDVVAEAPAANKLALTYERLGESERALAAHRRALAAAQRSGSRRNQASAWLSIGQWCQREQRWAEALSATNRCLELASDSLKPVVRLALAGIYQGMEAPADALEQLERAYKPIRQGDDLANQLVCARQIAELRRQLGRRGAALAALQDAIDLAHALGLPEEATLRDKLTEWKTRTP